MNLSVGAIASTSALEAAQRSETELIETIVASA
jgi:hypothetical protein